MLVELFVQVMDKIQLFCRPRIAARMILTGTRARTIVVKLKSKGSGVNESLCGIRHALNFYRTSFQHLSPIHL